MHRSGRSKQIVWLMIMLLLVMVVPGMSWADNEDLTARVNYLALGDSLAEGYTPYPEIINGEVVPVFDNGYPDFIAQKLNEDGRLDSFEQRYAVSGFTTANVLNAILTDFHRNLPGNPDTIGIRENIRKADIITLDVGANDLLELLRNPAGLDLTPTAVYALIGKISTNLTQTMIEIKTLNPQAKVYLMGYYNAFPYMPIEQQNQIRPVFEAVNTAIQNVAINTGATFIPTYDAINKHLELYLPNPANIHLSQQGYQAIAKEFWQHIKFDIKQ